MNISGSFTISTIYNQSKVPHHNVQVGKLSLELVEQNDTIIRLYNAYPMSDESLYIRPSNDIYMPKYDSFQEQKACLFL